MKTGMRDQSVNRLRMRRRGLGGATGALLIVIVSIYLFSDRRAFETAAPGAPSIQNSHEAHSGWSLRTIVSDILGKRKNLSDGNSYQEIRDPKALGYISATEIEVPRSDIAISVTQPHFASVELDSNPPDVPESVNGNRPERDLARD
jgi:hypothetical protein